MPDRAWKVVERWLCRLLGGERDWEHGPECKGTGIWAAEAKYRKKIPAWLEEMVLQSERLAKDSQFPFVVLFEHHRPRMDALVITRLDSFYEWFVSPPAGGHNEDESNMEEE